MLTARELGLAVMVGGILVLFGLYPPPIQHLSRAIRDFGDLLSSRFFPSQAYRTRMPVWRTEDVQPRRWLPVAVGAAVIVVAVFAYAAGK